jgi:hypothetical protein
LDHHEKKGEYVRKNYIIGTSLAIVCSTAAFAGQTPTTTPTQQPQAKQGATTTLAGCVYREKDVPGRAPNVAERAGVLEDYILAEIAPKPDTATSPTTTPGATGTSGTAQAKLGSMYKLELIPDEKLRAVVGKRVEVTGRIDAEAGDSTAPAGATPPTSTTDRALGRDRIDLPEFEVTSIREVSGTCPATPTAR